MQRKTEEFMHFLLWSAEKLCRPTFRNLTDSYESWAYRNGLLRRAADLEQKQLIEHRSAVPGDRLYRLTSRGRLHALGGRDPEACWSRSWDGQWRLVIFDVPETRNSDRAQLRRRLRNRGFGCLQQSVWITPDPLNDERAELADGKINVESLILLQATACAGESNREIVEGAWDFDRINYQYGEYLRILGEKPSAPLTGESSAQSFLLWARSEREAWLEAVKNDPLLPECLLPKGYRGHQAWRSRIETLQQAREQLNSFRTAD